MEFHGEFIFGRFRTIRKCLDDLNSKKRNLSFQNLKYFFEEKIEIMNFSCESIFECLRIFGKHSGDLFYFKNCGLGWVRQAEHVDRPSIPSQCAYNRFQMRQSQNNHILQLK